MRNYIMSLEVTARQFDEAYRAIILTQTHYDYSARKGDFIKSIQRLKHEFPKKNNKGFLEAQINEYHGKKIASIFNKACSQEPCVEWKSETFVFKTYAIEAALECKKAYDHLKGTDEYKRYVESKKPAYEAVMQADRSEVELLKDKVSSLVYDRIIKWQDRKDERSFSLRIE